MTTATTATTGKPMTPAQKDVFDFVVKHFSETGTSPSQRQIQAALGFAAVNGIKEKIGVLMREGYLTAIPLEGQVDNYGHPKYKPNSIRPSNWQEMLAAKPAKPTVGEFASYGKNFAFVIMGEQVAFMFFNDEKRASDVMPLTDALAIAANFKFTEGSDVERLAKLAEKTAAKRLR